MISLHGGYYGNNFGDLLLMKIFENWIQESGHHDVVYPMIAEGDLNSFKEHFPKANIGLSHSNHWKALIYGGGGHFGEPDGYENIRFRGAWNKKFLQKHVLPAEICLWKKIPYAISGVEAGPLTNIFVNREVKRVFSNASFVTVRNTESLEFVQHSLGKKIKVAVAPDPVLTLSEADIPKPAIEAVECLLEPYQGTTLLGIHAPYAFLKKDPHAELLLTGLTDFLASKPELLPVIFADSGDLKESTKTCQELSKIVEDLTGIKALSVPFRDIWETVALISRLSALITTKLHVGIVAYSLGIYCEAFATHQKTPRFYNYIGRSSQCTHVNNIDQAIVMNKFERAAKNACSHTSTKDQKWQQIKEDSDMNRKLVLSFLSSVL